MELKLQTLRFVELTRGLTKIRLVSLTVNLTLSNFDILKLVSDKFVTAAI